MLAAVEGVSGVRALTYDSIGRKIYCSLYQDHQVAVIDAKADTVMTTVDVGENPWALFHNRDLNRIYCANTGSNTVTVIDAEADSVLSTPPVGDNPGALAYDPNSGKVYCANFDGSSISVIQSYPKPETPAVIHQFWLQQNYPNPFNTSTTIHYSVPDIGPAHAAIRFSGATLEIYNILGQKVKTLVDEPKKPGDYVSTWDGKNDAAKEVASGIYLCRLKVGDFIETKKMLLLK